MGAAAHGGKGFKERKQRARVNGERLIGAASCRQQYNQASCPPRPPRTPATLTQLLWHTPNDPNDDCSSGSDMSSMSLSSGGCSRSCTHLAWGKAKPCMCRAGMIDRSGWQTTNVDGVA